MGAVPGPVEGVADDVPLGVGHLQDLVTGIVPVGVPAVILDHDLDEAGGVVVIAGVGQDDIPGGGGDGQGPPALVAVIEGGVAGARSSLRRPAAS